MNKFQQHILVLASAITALLFLLCMYILSITMYKKDDTTNNMQALTSTYDYASEIFKDPQSRVTFSSMFYACELEHGMCTIYVDNKQRISVIPVSKAVRLACEQKNTFCGKDSFN